MAMSDHLRGHAPQRVPEYVDLAVAELVEHADDLVRQVFDLDRPANPIGFPMISMVGNDDAEALGEARDDLVVVHFAVETPSVDEQQRARRVGARFANKELLIADQNGAPGDVKWPFLGTDVARLPLGAEQAPQHPTETQSAEGTSNESHRSSVGGMASVGIYHGPMVALSMHRFGSDAPTVLLLHGLSSAAPVWWRVGDALATAGHSSAAPDLRGHGASAHPGEYSLDGYALDVVASCPGPWQLVIGHSLGGAVAVRSAAIHPAFSNRYLLVDPAIDFDPIAAETVRSSIVAEVADPPSVEQLLAEHPHWDRKDAELKRDALLATSVEVIDRSISDNREWELGRDLASINVPVHILGAADEPLYSSDHFAGHGLGNPTMTFEVVPETGHSIHRDAPDVVIGRARGMLED